MKIQTENHGAVAVVVPHGPLVGEETLDLQRALAAAVAAKRRVVVDMTHVPYLDSRGIEMLLEQCGGHVPAHQRPRLAALAETCAEALELTDVLPRLEVFDTVENALRGLRR